MCVALRGEKFSSLPSLAETEMAGWSTSRLSSVILFSEPYTARYRSGDSATCSRTVCSSRNSSWDGDTFEGETNKLPPVLGVPSSVSITMLPSRKAASACSTESCPKKKPSAASSSSSAGCIIGAGWSDETLFLLGRLRGLESNLRGCDWSHPSSAGGSRSIARTSPTAALEECSSCCGTA